MAALWRSLKIFKASNARILGSCILSGEMKLKWSLNGLAKRTDCWLSPVFKLRQVFKSGPRYNRDGPGLSPLLLVRRQLSSSISLCNKHFDTSRRFFIVELALMATAGCRFRGLSSPANTGFDATGKRHAGGKGIGRNRTRTGTFTIKIDMRRGKVNGVPKLRRWSRRQGVSL